MTQRSQGAASDLASAASWSSMDPRWVVYSTILSVCLFAYVWFSARYSSGADIMPSSQLTQLRSGAFVPNRRRAPEVVSPSQYDDQLSSVRDREVEDVGARCKHSGICDSIQPFHDPHNCDPGPDGLGCTLEAGERRATVISAVKWAWDAYERCAWGHDELQPVSCESREWMGAACTLLDSLDTLVLAGMNSVRALLADAHQLLHAPHAHKHACLPFQACVPPLIVTPEQLYAGGRACNRVDREQLRPRNMARQARIAQREHL